MLLERGCTFLRLKPYNLSHDNTTVSTAHIAVSRPILIKVKYPSLAKAFWHDTFLPYAQSRKTPCQATCSRALSGTRNISPRNIQSLQSGKQAHHNPPQRFRTIVRNGAKIP